MKDKLNNKVAVSASRPLNCSTACENTKPLWFFECRVCKTNCEALVSDPPYVHENYCSIECQRWEQLARLRLKLQKAKYSYAAIARSVGKSPSQIGNIMRGDYPFYGANKLPKYLREWFEANNIKTHDALITW